MGITPCSLQRFLSGGLKNETRWRPHLGLCSSIHVPLRLTAPMACRRYDLPPPLRLRDVDPHCSLRSAAAHTRPTLISAAPHTAHQPCFAFLRSLSSPIRHATLGNVVQRRSARCCIAAARRAHARLCSRRVYRAACGTAWMQRWWSCSMIARLRCRLRLLLSESVSS